ncbi:MAG: tetratricopeptide repeat protein [Planctomycetota bacterium]
MRNLILAVTAVLLLLPLDPAREVQAAGQVDKFLDLGEFHLRRRSWNEAKRYFAKAKEASPGDVNAHVGYQEAVLRSGKSEGLQTEYDNRHTRAPDNPANAYLLARLLDAGPALKILEKAPRPTFHVHLGKARALRALDRGADAAGEIATAEARCPEEPRAMGLLAGYFEDGGRHEKAAELYAAALKLAPKRIDALVGLANNLRLAGKLDEAMTTIEKAAKIDGEDPEVLYRKGLVLFDKGDGIHAAQVLGGAVALAPKTIEFVLAWGEAFLLQEKYREAERKFEIAVGLDARRVDVRRRLAHAQELQDKNDAALKNYKEIVKRAPLDNGARISIAWIYIKKGKYDSALRELKQASDNDPKNAMPHFLIGYAYDKMGRWGEAADAYQKAVKLDPEYAWAWNNLGLDQNYLGKTPKAVRSFQKAVKLDPENLEFQLNLAYAFYDSKKYKDAAATFGDVVDLDPKMRTAWVGLGLSLKKMRKYAEAKDAFERALELNSEDADLHLMVGIIYDEQLKDDAKALEHYEAYVKLGGTDPNVSRWIEEKQEKVK